MPDYSWMNKLIAYKSIKLLPDINIISPHYGTSSNNEWAQGIRRQRSKPGLIYVIISAPNGLQIRHFYRMAPPYFKGVEISCKGPVPQSSCGGRPVRAYNNPRFPKGAPNFLPLFPLAWGLYADSILRGMKKKVAYGNVTRNQLHLT